MIQFSVLTKDSGILTKNYTLLNGELIKDSSQCYLDTGTVETISCELSDLPSVIDKLETNQAIAHGIALEAVSQSVKIVSRKLLPQHPGAITRTLDKFFWPEDGIIMFDYDPPVGTKPLNRQELTVAIRSLDPQLEKAAMVWRPSASSNIVGEDDKVYAGVKNQRIYIQYSHPEGIEEFTQNLFRSAWDKGFGYIMVSAAGIPLEKCIFDMSVFSPERLDFAAGGHCGEGLKKQVIKSIFSIGTVVDLNEIQNKVDVFKHQMLVSAAKREIEGEVQEKRAEYLTQQAILISEKQGITKAKARVVVESRMDHKLLPDDVVYTDDMEPISIRNIILNPNDYHEMVIRDPLEPEYGKSKAKIFVDEFGVCIHSFAHGKQVYRVKYDVDYVMSLLQGLSGAELSNVWGSHYGNMEATPIAKEKVAQYVAEGLGVSKTAVLKEMAGLDKKNVDSRKPPMLSHNEMAVGAIAALGKGLIATEGSLYSFDGVRWIKRPAALAMNKVIEMYDGCEQCRTVGHYRAISSHMIDCLDHPTFFSEQVPVVATKDKYWRLDPDRAEVTQVPVDKKLRVRFIYPFESSEESGEPEMFLTFLRWAFEKDIAQVNLMQEVMGAVFFGTLTRHWQKAILFKGTGLNGKNTLLDVIKGMMPKEFISDVSPDRFNDDNHKIMLAGKLLNICPELEKGKPLPSAAFKSIIDAGTITARAVYERAASFESTAAHVFSSNHRLVLNDDSRGMRRRWLFFSFDSTINEDEKVFGLADAIVKAESAKIFNWAVAGLCRLYKTNMFTDTFSNAKVASQTFIGQNPLADFLQDADVVETLDVAPTDITPAAAQKYFVASKPLYVAYKKWFTDNVPSKKTSDIMDFTVFCEKLEEKYGAQCRVQNMRGWKGIKLIMRQAA